MNQIFRIKNAVVDYLSPVAKRRRTIGPRTPGYSAIDHEQQFLSEPRNNMMAFNFSYDNMTQDSIVSEDKAIPFRNPLKRPREDDEVGESIFSGDEISPDHSSSQIGTESDFATEGDEGSEVNPDLMDEDEEEDEDEVSAEQKVNEYLARQAAELARAKETVGRAREEGEWSPEEIFLLERLQYMGHEGILPHWAKQYWLKTVPEAMWCANDDYNALLGDSSKAVQMFLFLNNYLGRRVHDRYRSGYGSPEYQMKIWIAKYVEYTEREGGYNKKKFIPVLCLVRGRWKASAAETTKRLQDQMNFHAESWRRSLLRPSPIVNDLGKTEIYFRRPPIIYGILYIQAKALFVTLDSSNPDAKIRDIHICDFLDSKKHFWHAVSVAIVVKIAQKYMESIKDGLEDDDPPEQNSESEDDLESRSECEKRLRKEARQLKRQKEREREEELRRLEQQMNEIKMEEDANYVMESIEEYERVSVIESEEEEEDESEDDRPSVSEYSDEDEQPEMEFEGGEESEVDAEDSEEAEVQFDGEESEEVDGAEVEFDAEESDEAEDAEDAEVDEVEAEFEEDENEDMESGGEEVESGEGIENVEEADDDEDGGDEDSSENASEAARENDSENEEIVSIQYQIEQTLESPSPDESLHH